MPRARMSVQHAAWLAALIDLYGADFLIRRIKNGKSGKTRGRRAHPSWAKRMRNLNFFQDVLREGMKGSPAFAMLIGKSDLDGADRRKLNAAIAGVAKNQKPPMDIATARRKFRTARATFWAWNRSGQKRLDVAWPHAPML